MHQCDSVPRKPLPAPFPLPADSPAFLGVVAACLAEAAAALGPPPGALMFRLALARARLLHALWACADWSALNCYMLVA